MNNHYEHYIVHRRAGRVLGHASQPRPDRPQWQHARQPSP